MNLQLQWLVWSIALGLVYLMAYACVILKSEGVMWTAGPRDEGQPQQGLAGRLARAQRNYMETWPFFAAAVLLAHVLARESAQTEWGCLIYFWARVAYLPLYAFGVPWLRSLAWVVSMLGLVMVLAALF
ncbi:MAPEG family protein [Silvimonas iriomotensis]|uniref:Membrane protein n=1 Tax=Silvimonas iriomotensis TaxID=449662 RepID=A0ABQ2PFQ1_9NEIS|nr:MAPEG family protein [Silvimonas iriomotensis]GGP24081.1 membrane protein [Silvimonas iriomotensis]